MNEEIGAEMVTHIIRTSTEGADLDEDFIVTHISASYARYLQQTMSAARMAQQVMGLDCELTVCVQEKPSQEHRIIGGRFLPVEVQRRFQIAPTTHLIELRGEFKRHDKYFQNCTLVNTTSGSENLCLGIVGECLKSRSCKEHWAGPITPYQLQYLATGKRQYTETEDSWIMCLRNANTEPPPYRL